MRGKEKYDATSLDMLARKVLLCFEAARRLGSSAMFTGLLGGGAFRGSRPLVLLLHMLLEPYLGNSTQIVFHYPIFSSFSKVRLDVLENWILEGADELMDYLRRLEVKTLRDALNALQVLGVKTSQEDADLLCTAGATRHQWADGSPIKRRRTQTTNH